ncbi:MAG: RNA polymerase sigma factor [Rhodothermales bacterium]
MAHNGVQDDPLRRHLLVLRCQAGDEQAFSELYDRFHRRTLRYLQGLLDEQAAQDVQQEVWLTVFQKIAMLANPNGFRTWLYRTTRHRAIDFLRREKRQSDLLKAVEDDLADVSIRLVDEPLPPPGSPYLDAAMARLSSTHRDVLILRFWEGMSYAEIALIVGCSIGTVRSRIHHAKRNIKNALEGAPL